MAQGSGDAAHIFTSVNQQRGVQMAELMNAQEGEPIFFAKSFQPFIGLFGGDWGTVQFGK